jgi:FtsH-binding integral membrane protein
LGGVNISNMKANFAKRIPFYPLLFILFLVLFPLVNNPDQVNPEQALRPLVVLYLVEAVLLLLFQLLVKNWQYASYLSFLTFLLMFLYGPITVIGTDKLASQLADAMPWIVMGILLALAIILSPKNTWNRLGGSSRVTPFLNLVIAILVIGQAVTGLPAIVKLPGDPSPQLAEEVSLLNAKPDLVLDCSISPDIYWIVLDGYGRADVLKEIYGADVSPTLASLREKGFTIAEQSHANYIQTLYSIPSTLFFNYMEPMPSDLSGYDYFPALIANNPTKALLRQCGYKMVTFESGFTFTNYPESDLYLSDGDYFNELEELLFASTPLGYLTDKLDLTIHEWSYASHRSRVGFALGKLGELPELPGPKFVFAHIISPHPPFVFDAQGHPVQPESSYSINDGDDYAGSWKEYRAGYAAQVQYVNQLLEQIVSEIINRSPAPPVVIVQADHGPGGHLVWKSPDRTCLWERTSILNAYYLPNGGSQSLYPTISPVNSFRIVLNAYFGLDLELLPDETYFTSHLTGRTFTNVTDRQESRQNCGD